MKEPLLHQVLPAKGDDPLLEQVVTATAKDPRLKYVLPEFVSKNVVLLRCSVVVAGVRRGLPQGTPDVPHFLDEGHWVLRTHNVDLVLEMGEVFASKKLPLLPDNVRFR